MKKIRNILLISIILFSLTSNFNKVEAVGSVNLTSNTSKVYLGDTFTVSVNVSGISAATLTIKLGVDTNKVDYVSGPGNSNFVNGRVIYTWTDPNGGENPITSGTVATFKFKAKESGTASFSISGEFYDQNENIINPSFSGTSVILQEKGVTPPSGNSGNNNNQNGETIGNNNNQITTGGNTGNNTGGNSQTTSGRYNYSGTNKFRWKCK